MPEPGEVREVAFPANARELTTLARIDYTDAVVLGLPQVRERTAEEWARATLEQAPAETRASLRRGWFALGVRLGSSKDPRRVLGWELRRSSPDCAVIAARSVFGMDAEVLFIREREALLVTTAMKLNHPFVSAFWAGFSFQHRRVVRHLLKGCGRRALEAGPGAPYGAWSRPPSRSGSRTPS